MTDKEAVEWQNRKNIVLRRCPRGEEYFCDGSINKSIKGWDKLKPLDKCPHRKGGKCRYLDRT